MNANILTNPIVFRESFFAETSGTKVDTEYGAVLNVILYYIWRGCSLSREAGLTGKTDPTASLIAQSAYEATLAVIQLLRIGYVADAATLLRALMERIAFVGYLGENRHLIAQHFEGDLSLYTEALAWAQEQSIPNWIILYDTLSDIVHFNLVGLAGHINNYTEIGATFRLVTKKDPGGTKSSLDELIGLTIYSVYILDALALELIQNRDAIPFSEDPDLVKNVGPGDAKEFLDFLQKIGDRDGNQP